MAGEEDRWEIYKDRRNKFRWRRIAKTRNRAVLGSACEGYSRKTDCIKSAERHGMNGNPEKLGTSDSWEIYQDKREAFRWRRVSKNGEVTGASSSSFDKRADAQANAIRNGMPKSETV